MADKVPDWAEDIPDWAEDATAPVAPPPEEHHETPAPIPAQASLLDRAGSTALDAVRGFGQGVSYGFGDELAGAGGALLDKAMGDKRSLGDLYRESRDFARKDNAGAKERSPYAYGGSELAGAVAAPGGGTGFARAVAQGAAMGLGGSDADVTEGEYGKALRDTAIGGVAGGAGQQFGSRVLSPAMSRIAAKLQPLLKNTAEESAVKGVGAIQGDLKKIRGPLTGDTGLGRKILDAVKPNGKRLLGFGSSKKAIQQGAEEIVDDSGEKVGAILKALDDKSGKAFDWKRAAGRLDQAVEEIDPVETQILGKALEDMKKAFEVAEQRGGGFALANKMKTTLYKNIGHWVPDPSIKAELRQKLAGVFNREIESQLEEKYGKVALEHLQDAAAARAGSNEFSRRAATKGAERLEGGAARALPEGENVALARAEQSGLKGKPSVDEIGGELDVRNRLANAGEEVAGGEAGKKGPNFRVDVSTPPPPRRIGVPVNPEDEEAARKLGAEALRQFQGAKQSFGLGSEVEGLAEKGHLRELGNRHVSLTDYLTMGIAGAAGVGGHGGAGVGTLALGLAHKMARERGRAAVAVSADAAQVAMKKAIPYLQAGGPKALGNFARALSTELAAYYDKRPETQPAPKEYGEH